MPRMFDLKPDEEKNKKNPIKVAGKVAKYIPQIILLAKILLLLVSILAIFSIFSWITDLFQSQNNPKVVYESLGIEDLSEIISVAGNEKDGYYLAFNEGIDAKLDEIVKQYEKAGTQYMSKEILLKTIQAELYTQYPDLGGKIGHEAKVEKKSTGDSNEATAVQNSSNKLLHWPTDANKKVITSYFGIRKAPTEGASENHGAIDIDVSTGSNVYACANGTVTIADAEGNSSAGKYIKIKHTNGYESLYMHNSQLKVSVGSTVTAGQLIAISGNTGVTTGAHLHFEIRKNDKKLDPLSFKYDNGMGDGTATESFGSNEAEKKLVIGKDTGEGLEGFQGAIRIRRVMPDKTLGVYTDSFKTEALSDLGEGEEISSEINNYLEQEASSASWSVYVKNLKTDKDEVTINNNVQYSAGKLYKLFIMAAAYQNMLEYSSVNYEEKITKMMVNDDDGEAKNLIAIIGKDKINTFVKINGYINTVIEPKGEDSKTTSKDVGKILRDIYSANCVSKEASDKMIELLKKSKKENKNIIAGYSNFTETAGVNNSASYSKFVNDADIVYKKDSNYILVIMASDVSKKESVEKDITNISKKVYDGVNKTGDSESNANKKVEHVIAVVAGHGNEEGVEKNWYTKPNADETGELKEEELNIKVVQYVEQIIKTTYPQLKVVTEGYSTDDAERLKIAKTQGAELFVGVHFNYDINLSKRGTSVYYQNGTNYQEQSGLLAKKLLQTVRDEMETPRADGAIYKNINAFMNGKQDEFGGPAVYVEGAYLSNDRDLEIIRKDDEEGLKRYAQGIVAGILEYYGIENTGYIYNDKISKDDIKTVDTRINSRIFDLKFTTQETFDKMIENKDEKVLEYYTLDGNLKLITAKWSYSSDEGLTFSKNTAINYKTTLQKYTTPFEYLVDYYINIKDDKFINQFADLALNSEFIIAVQDNVSTTKTIINSWNLYSDNTKDDEETIEKISEYVSDTIELTYADTWFVKFSKETNYLNNYGGNLVGDKGELVGNDYKTTSFCYVCNDVDGNYGTNIGNHDNVLVPYQSVAIHLNDPHGLKTGDYLWIEGNVYVVDDSGAGKPGAWMDFYVEKECDIRGLCCINSVWADRRNVEVYRATNVRATNNGNNSVNTSGKIKGTVTFSNGDSVVTTEPGPTKTVSNLSNYEYTYVPNNLNELVPDIILTSTKYTVTQTESISNKYVTGESEVKGNEFKFIKLFKDNPEALNRLKPKWLITNVSRGQKTSSWTDITKYLLYKLLDVDFGVTSFDFSIYKDNDFISMNGSGGLQQFLRWLHKWEGINGSISEDGTMYTIGDDGYGHPTVGYGVDIFNGGHADEFRAAGYPTNVGGQVPVEFVDGIEKREIQRAIEKVDEICSGIELTQYQKYAMVSRIFNCGSGSLTSSGSHAGAFGIRNGKNFIEAFTAYWNKETDDEYGVAANEGMFSHTLYTNYMNVPVTSEGKYSPGLKNRREAEWLLFKTGYYDRIDEYYQEGGDILAKAQEIHTYMEQNNYRYCLFGKESDPRHDGLGGPHGLSKNFEASKTGYHLTCCATYVAWVLNECGYTECEGINSCAKLYPTLLPKSIKIDNYSELQPGDICFAGDEHVQIYAGDGLWYNAGGNSAIEKTNPYAMDFSDRFTYALRLQQ